MNSCYLNIEEDKRKQQVAMHGSCRLLVKNGDVLMADLINS